MKIFEKIKYYLYYDNKITILAWLLIIPPLKIFQFLKYSINSSPDEHHSNITQFHLQF